MSAVKILFVVLLCLLVHNASAFQMDSVLLKQAFRRKLIHAAESANMTMQLENSFFAKITEAVVPLINKEATAITIPGQTEKHFSFASFKLSEFKLGSVSITFQEPNKIVVSLDDLSMAVPHTHFDVFDWIIIKITCSGDFWVSVTNTNFHLTMTVDTDAATQQLQVTDVSAAVDFGSLKVDHFFGNFFCKIGQDIIQLLVGNIDNLITKLVKKDLPSMASKLVKNAMNKVFAKIPLPVLGQPVISDNSLALTVDIIPRTHQRLSPRFSGIRSLRRPRALPDRDIALEIADLSLDELMQYLRNRGDLDKNITIPPNKYNTSALEKLIPAAYQLCPNCPFSIEINMVNAPTVTFLNQGVTLYVMNSIFGLNAVNPSGAIVPLIDMNLNTTSVLSNFSILGSNKSTIMFQLAIPSFAVSVYESQIGPINAKDLTGLMDFMLKDIVVPEFNKNFKGITIPTEDGFGIDNLVLMLQNDIFSLGLDIILPPL